MSDIHNEILTAAGPEAYLERSVADRLRLHARAIGGLMTATAATVSLLVAGSPGRAPQPTTNRASNSISSDLFITVNNNRNTLSLSPMAYFSPTAPNQTNVSTNTAPVSVGVIVSHG